VAIGGSHTLPDSKDCQHELCCVCHVLPFRVRGRYLRPGDNFAKRTGRSLSGERPMQWLNRVSTDWGTAAVCGEKRHGAQVRTTTSSTA
jgi:hypothetical protein